VSDRSHTVAALHAARPRSAFLRWSAVGAGALTVWAWWAGSFDPGDLVSAQRMRNLKRFLGEIRPYPLQGADWSWGVAWDWTWTMFTEGVQGAMFEMPSGAEAVGLTLAISIVAIVLAGIGGVIAAFPAAHTFATPHPFLPGSNRAGPLAHRAWRVLLLVTRGLLIFMRSIPEYVWAFLLIGMLGISAWPAVLALAIHNTGILGKLDAETVENLSPKSLAAMRGVGASRRQVAVAGALPAALSRFLLYFFYRWETCVREATVLGMLGIVSLGYALNEARIRDRYDEMVFYVALGAILVLVGDLVSAVARSIVRRSS
jgi:phosphonate transport system permease protein